jgi:hypothetical protein
VLAQGRTCMSANECCSGFCFGFCCDPLGASCSTDADCCTNNRLAGFCNF